MYEYQNVYITLARLMVTPLKPKNPTDRYFSSKVPTYGAARPDTAGRRRNKSAVYSTIYAYIVWISKGY